MLEDLCVLYQEMFHLVRMCIPKYILIRPIRELIAALGSVIFFWQSVMAIWSISLTIYAPTLVHLLI